MRTKLSCLALVVTFAAQAAAFGQNSTNNQSGTAKPAPGIIRRLPAGQNYPPRTQPYKRDESQFKFEVLSKAPDLPDMPPYPSSAKFLDSSVSPNAKGGPAYHVLFTCSDPPTQIIQYYESMLPSMRWKIQRHTASTIYAVHGGNTVNVFVQRASRPNMKCDMWVIFSSGKQGRTT